MTIVRQLLTNGAYGRRRVKPFVLACVHITGNSKTAAYSDPHKAAQAERNYANRDGSRGPSAHYYIARDGWGIEAIDATRHWAWSNGDVSRPNTDNPGIRRVLALRAKGYNANEAYWLEFECVGYPRSYPITTAQIQTMGRLIAERARLSGLPINRETVHGHWEINGIDRQLCPDINHEPFLQRVIAAAGVVEEPDMRPFPVGVDPKTVDIRVGAQLYNLDLSTTDAPTISLGNDKPSPYAYRTGEVNYRVVEVATGGVQHLWLVKLSDCSDIKDPPTPSPSPPTVLGPGYYEVR
jgi:hypothetical protein